MEELDLLPLRVPLLIQALTRTNTRMHITERPDEIFLYLVPLYQQQFP